MRDLRSVEEFIRGIFIWYLLMGECREVSYCSTEGGENFGEERLELSGEMVGAK